MARRVQQRRAVVLGLASVVAATALLVLVSILVSRGTIDGSRLAPEEFFVGGAERLAREIDDRGPFLMPDASPNRHRDLYVQHLGSDPDRGWYAIGAQAPGQDDRTCTIRPRQDGFVDPCTEQRYPADGQGLTRYATRVEDGAVYVDLRRPLRRTAP